MNKIDFAKAVVTGIVGTSTGFVTRKIIANNVNPETVIQQGEAIVGATVIGAMVAERSKAWTDKKIDDAVDWWKQNIKN